MSACIRLLIATRCELRGRCWWRHDHHVFVAGVVWPSRSPICLSLSAVANDSWDPLNVSILQWHVIVNKAVLILEHDNLWTVCIYRLECYCFEINVTWFCTILELIFFSLLGMWLWIKYCMKFFVLRMVMTGMCYLWGTPL